jgi:hypothetical protein
MKAALLLVLMTSTAAADGLGDGDVYLIRADGWAEPSCQKWHVDTNQQEMTHRAGKLHEEVSFDLSTIEIHFTEFKYTLDDTIGAEDVNANPACKLTADIERVRDGWRVGTARWFSTKKACTAALKKRERVGTTFGCPTPEDFPIFLTAYLNDFADILAKGGTMFAEPKCTPVKFDAETTHDADAQTVTLCSTDLKYAAKDDGILLGNVRLYFDRDRCVRYARAHARVASFLPVVAAPNPDALPSCK